MKLRQRVNGKAMDIELRRDADRVEFRTTAGEEPFPSEWRTADVREVEPGVYSVMLGSRVFDVRLEHTHYGTVVQMGAERLLLEEARRAGGGVSGAGASQRVVAAMPGRVVRILAEEGTAVTEGQGLLVLEAMKMQNEITAPRAGVVRNLGVRDGATVMAGALLCTVE